MVKRFIKYRKIRVENHASRGFDLSYGKFALRSLDSGKITKEQIESARMSINRTCSRKGRLFIRLNRFFPVTKKPLEVRMGGGKGGIDHFIARVAPGTVLFEIDNVPDVVALEALKKAAYKLPVSCSVSTRKFCIG